MSAKILVVDDEPDMESLIRQRFRKQIRSGDYDFIFAGDGLEGIGAIKSECRFDVILSDINMPRMDGLKFLEHVREFDEDLRAVVVTAYGDTANIRTAMNRGAFDFVTKPIDMADLENTLQRTLNHTAMIREMRRQKSSAEQARAALSRYFSPNLVEELARNPKLFELGGERRELTFLFTDLADFTPLVESLEPTLVVALLNEYLDNITEIVFRHQGTVEKIVGDAVHAMFGAPLDCPDHAARAVACALDIDAFARRFEAEVLGRGLPLGETRIGINTGTAIVGNFGGKLYFDYTAHGDAINVAARLETANKVLGTRICVSEYTVAQVPGFKGRPVGELVLKGKNKSLGAYEPLHCDQHATPATSAYVAAYDKLDRGDPVACQAFASVVGEHGNDPLAAWARQHGLAIRDASGRVIRVIGSTGDITEQKELGEELEQTRQRLLVSDKLASLGQLTAGVAHEIKNPLNFVNNFAALSLDLLDELQDELAPLRQGLGEEGRVSLDEIVDMLADNLSKIAEHGNRADSIVKSMLLHCREGTAETREVNIQDLVEEALRLAYHGARLTALARSSSRKGLCSS